MRVWRLARRRYAMTVADAFSGMGAAHYGGRWNSPDVRLAYASATLSLAALELRVHSHLHNLATDYVLAWADIPEDSVIELGTPPVGWNEVYPPAEVAAIGDDFVRTGGGLALAVPSVVIPRERNYLINPLHRDAARIRFANDLEPFAFDLRLFL